MPATKAAVTVVEDRPRHDSEEGDGMDVAAHPGLGHRRRIGPHVGAVAVRKVEHEEVRFAFSPPITTGAFPKSACV